jgi:hypothetical protein
MGYLYTLTAAVVNQLFSAKFIRRFIDYRRCFTAKYLRDRRTSVEKNCIPDEELKLCQATMLEIAAEVESLRYNI